MYIQKRYFILFGFFYINLYASDLKGLLEDLNNYSDKNNLNIDYKPSAMTVLYSEDLEVLGITTLSEALDFVPGLQTFQTTYISNTISSRGYTQPFNSYKDKIKFKIDGVDISSNFFENFPMSLVERIEISKGSASTIYDQSGYIAFIDIFTKNKNNITLGTGSFDRRNGSFIVNEKLDDSWDIKFDTYYLKHNKTVDAPNGLTTNSAGIAFDRKKESLEGKEDKGIGVLLQNGNFKISSRYIESFKQNNYGFAGYLDFNDEGYTKYKTFANQISYDSFVTENNSLETKLSFLQNNYQLNTFLYDFEPNNLGIYNPHYKVDYTQQESALSFLMKNKTFTNHSIEYGMQGLIREIPKNNYYANVDNLYKLGLYLPTYNAYFPTQKELVKFSGNDGFLSDTSSRMNLSYFVNDKYDFNENLSFLFNLSLDDYELNDKQMNYKFGTVYSNDQINIYKLIFSETNRTPSLIESSIIGHLDVAGNKSLEAEQMQNTEFMYIYQQNTQKLKLNFFYSIYKNSIDLRQVDNTLEYFNKSEDDDSYGVELEYTKNFENRSKLLLGASYNIFKYKNGNLDINTPLVSKDTINLGYIYPLNSKIVLSSLTRYYGTKEVLKNNDSIPSVVLFDLGTQYNFSKDLKISFSVKNVLDKDYFYWGNNIPDERMLREGRVFYTSLSYDF